MRCVVFVTCCCYVQVYKMCMSIGWNPFYQNKEKTAEPWILHEFDKVCWLGLLVLELTGLGQHVAHVAP